jgi:hypothetical protein
MLPKEGLPDRREARSEDPLIALARLFESARRRAGLDAIVLADDMGLTIAGAGSAQVCDDLAARGALVTSTTSTRPANDTVPCRMDVLARAMEVRRLRIDGIEVLLCAQGGSPASGGELSSAVSGCQRILSRRKKGMAAE